MYHQNKVTTALSICPSPIHLLTSPFYDRIRIENYCNDYAKAKGHAPFTTFDNLLPIVDTKSCFDDLRVGPDHVSRRPSDTYYVAKDTVGIICISCHILFKINTSIYHQLRCCELIRLHTKQSSFLEVKTRSCAVAMCIDVTKWTHHTTLSSTKWKVLKHF